MQINKSPNKKKKEHYVDNKQFYQAIVEHKDKSAKAIENNEIVPRLTHYLGDCIKKIATKLSFSPKYLNYSFREEMVSEAILNCVKYFDRYDPNYKNKEGKTYNPFTYFTQICNNSFIHFINMEEKNRYARYKNFEDNMILNGNVDLLVDSDENNLLNATTYDNITSFIDKFEKKEERRKEKRRLKIKEIKENEERSIITSTNTIAD